MIRFFKQHRSLIAYIIWGVATTAVNYCVYFLLTRLGNINYLISNISAWVVSVLFAFAVNKAFVFCSKNWSATTLIPELTKFVGARVFSGFLETGLLWLGVDLAHYHDGIVKILVGILVIALNYFFSKFFIFRKEKS